MNKFKCDSNFYYSHCSTCGKHIMYCIGAPKPKWFHTPTRDSEQPQHVPVPVEENG